MGIETKVYYDETSPTCLRFAVKCGRGRNVRRPGDVAGGGWYARQRVLYGWTTVGAQSCVVLTQRVLA